MTIISRTEITKTKFRANLISGIIAIFVTSGCSTLEGSDERYPKDLIKDPLHISREWADEDSSLHLNADGSFETKDLYAQYFECTWEKGPRSGKGSWVSWENRGASSVFLKFSDGCRATFWLGSWEGGEVLWTEFSTSDKIVRLKG